MSAISISDVPFRLEEVQKLPLPPEKEAWRQDVARALEIFTCRVEALMQSIVDRHGRGGKSARRRFARRLVSLHEECPQKYNKKDTKLVEIVWRYIKFALDWFDSQQAGAHPA